MKAFRLRAPKRDGSLQRRPTMTSVRDSIASSSGSKAHKKKEKLSPLLPTLGNEESGHEITEEDEDHGSEIPPTAPAVLSVPECEDILKWSIEGVESLLQEKLELTTETNLREAIILDYYVSAVYWAKQQGYTAHKLSDFVTVAHAIIQKVIEEHASVVELIKELQMMTNSECDKECRPIDRNLQHFSKEDKKAVIGYFYSRYFTVDSLQPDAILQWLTQSFKMGVLLQHLKLYHYVFSRGQAEEVIASELSVELPLPAETPFPPSLDEGMLESVMNDCLLLQTPSSEAEMIDASRTPSDIDMPFELVNIFAKLTLQDVKRIINETSATVLSNLQSDVEGKLKTQEAAMLGKIIKIRGED